MLLIVNADDLGASEEINQQIFALMAAGRITSASIMANGPAFAHAVVGARRFPECSFGVHLNLTEYAPLSRSPGLGPILDQHGLLSRKLHDIRVDRSLRAATQLELATQVQHALDAGVPVSHFDSHEHIHTLPSLFPVLKSLQREFGIRKVRSTINLLSPSEQMAPLRSFKKRLFYFWLSRRYETTSPEGLGHFSDFYAAMERGCLPHFQHLEVMDHPGHADYREETELLQTDWRRRLPPGVKLGSYHSIPAPSHCTAKPRTWSFLNTASRHGVAGRTL
jgi:chitin disaccharide deacetylase